MRQIIDDLREIAANPDVYEHDYPAIIQRIADRLEAAASTALVPVMVGEARELRALHTPYFTIGDGDVYQGPHNVTSLCARNKPCNFDKTLIVQPVRLVPALDVMEGRDDE